MGLAVNRQWRDAQGNSQEETCFVDITVFGRQAETCNEYLRKGRPVFVEGHLQYDTWDDRESGQKRSKLYVVAERVQFLGSRDGGGGGDRGERSAPPREREASPNGSAGGSPRAPAPAGAPGSQGVDFDDIPF
jgi:single-strand DNA-binding protein